MVVPAVELQFLPTPTTFVTFGNRFRDDSGLDNRLGSEKSMSFTKDITWLNASQLLFMRFGFSYARGIHFDTVQRTQWTLIKSMRVIGDSKDHHMFRIESGFEAAAIQFIMHLDRVGYPDSTAFDIPSSLCDLYEENMQFLKNVRSSISIQTIIVPSGPVYIIHHNEDSDRTWLLAVTDPCTALQAIRSDPPTIQEFTLNLIYSRTPFMTLRRVGATTELRSNSNVHKHKRPRIGLGQRPTGHRLDKSDFLVYEAERRRLLENARVARAAVKRGGILSQLLDGLVDDCDILSGPSREALEFPINFTVEVDGDKLSFYDDDLSEKEISILVGVYSIKAG